MNNVTDLPKWPLAALGIVSIAVYLLAPSSKNSQKKRKKVKSNDEETTESTELTGLYPPGLKNVGNTCFINSVLQCLSASDNVMKYLQDCIKTEMEKHGDAQAIPVHSTLLDTLNLLNKLEKRMTSFTPNDFLNLLNQTRQKMVSRRWSGYSQQDAHELYQLVSELLEEEYSESVKDNAEFSKITFPMEGKEGSRLKCHCGYSTPSRTSPFTAISLVPNSPTTPLIVLWKQYFVKEELQDASCPRESHNATKVAMEAQIVKSIRSLKKISPNVPCAEPEKLLDVFPGMTVLGREYEDLSMIPFSNHLEMDTPSDKKLRQFYDLWTQLHALELLQTISPEDFTDMTSLELTSLGIVPQRFIPKQPLERGTFVDKWPLVLAIHIQRSMYDRRAVKNPCIVSRIETTWKLKETYRLFAVLFHYGSHDSGHFVALINKNFEWFKVSDTQVQRVSLENELNLGGRHIYMIFYEKI